jgi:hypothetical protein
VDGVATKAPKTPLRPSAKRAESDAAPRFDAGHGRAASEPETGGNLAVQALLRGGAIRPKLSVSQPNDPDEHEADRVADAAVSDAPTIVRRKCASCEAGIPCGNCGDESTVRLKRNGAQPGPSAASAMPALSFLRSGGRPLSRDTRRDFEGRLGADLGAVRVHEGPSAAKAATALNARAFTVGTDIAFAPGQFAPDTRSGRHLLAHELAHTLQPPRPGQLPDDATLRRLTCTVSGPPQANPDADKVVQGVRDGKVDVVVTGMRGKSIPDLCALRSAVHAGTNEMLERWLLSRRNTSESIGSVNRAVAIGTALVNPVALVGVATTALLPGGNPGQKTVATAEEGLRLLLPALPLIDRLELYDEGLREIEQAQLDTIRAASMDERIAARAEAARLEVIYGRMGVKEEYDARLLIDPDQKVAAAERLLKRAPGLVSDDEDLVLDAIWALTPTERRAFFDKHLLALNRLLSSDQFKLLATLSKGTEAVALMARLRLATEGRLDDQEAIHAIVDRAVALLAEQKQLRATIAMTTLPESERSVAQKRLDELGDLEALVAFGKDKLDPNSFLGRLADSSSSPDAFGAMTRKLGQTISDPEQQREFVFRSAKQRILLAAGTFGGADEDAIRSAILEVRAPLPEDAAKLPPKERDQKQTEENNKIRKRLFEDKEVDNVIKRLVGSAQMRIESYKQATSFDEKHAELTLALNAANWGEFFQVLLQISKNDSWRASFQATATNPWDTYARVRGKPREIMLGILEQPPRIPIDKILEFTGNVEVLRTALANIDEETRSKLRLGYLLARSQRAPTNADESAALVAFQGLEAAVKASQTTLKVVDRAGIQTVLDAALGSEPTEAELTEKTGAGRYNAVAIMYERQQERLGLQLGASALFTETDETMQAAAREFAARWLPMRERKPPEVTALELAAFAALHDRFNHRSQEFTEASNTAGEIAGMVAATIAGIIIVAGTGGVTAPAVIAAAAAGASARVVTREMFGADYYNPASEQGGRDAVLGAIDAALAVVGASLGAKGAQMLGLGGRALLANAARVGGEVAEQASQGLLRRVTAHAVEAAIDGAFSGFVSEAANAMTDARTWRRGVWAGLVRTGQAALLGGLFGLAGGGAIGGALPIVGAGFRSAADRLLGASVEKTLAHAGATETLEAARAAVRKGNLEEAQRLFSDLEKHLSAEQANLLWRDLSRLADTAALLEEPIMILGERHTLRLVESERGSFFVLCTWCTEVKKIFQAALDAEQKKTGSTVIRRLEEMLEQLETMEANITKGKISKKKAQDVNALKTLLRMLSEGEHLIGKTLTKKAPFKRQPVNFSGLTNNPAIAARAEQLYQDYFEQLMYAREKIFHSDDLKKLVAEEAKARALHQARDEIMPGAQKLGKGAEARAAVDQLTDFPYGFYKRADFDVFAKRLHAELQKQAPGAKLVLEGSSVTGRRFERLVDFEHTGTPFGLSKMSDFDIAIVSDELFEVAQKKRIPMAKDVKGPGKAVEATDATKVLEAADLKALELEALQAEANKAAIEATGLAYPVHFKVRKSSAAGAAVSFTLQP